MGRTELFENALRKDKRLVQLIKEHKWNMEEIQAAVSFIDLPGPYGLHRGMFIPTIIWSGNRRTKKKIPNPST
ncbi:unnamed protein product [Rhizophagus irregularis]|nr:unnamed protein product [Rhizophagus irregularis]